jgi:hypothetical protein
MKKDFEHPVEPDLEIAIPCAIPLDDLGSLDLTFSLQSLSDADETVARVIDVLGSAVAEAAGWRPLEAEDQADAEAR